MLDQELARLARTPPEISLEGLEQAVWRRIEVAARRRTYARTVSRAQGLALGAAVIASAAVGAALAQPRGRDVMQVSAVVAELAPSTLLGPAR